MWAIMYKCSFTWAYISSCWVRSAIINLSFLIKIYLFERQSCRDRERENKNSLLSTGSFPNYCSGWGRARLNQELRIPFLSPTWQWWLHPRYISNLLLVCQTHLQKAGSKVELELQLTLLWDAGVIDSSLTHCTIVPQHGPQWFVFILKLSVSTLQL